MSFLDDSDHSFPAPLDMVNIRLEQNPQTRPRDSFYWDSTPESQRTPVVPPKTELERNKCSALFYRSYLADFPAGKALLEAEHLDELNTDHEYWSSKWIYYRAQYSKMAKRECQERKSAAHMADRRVIRSNGKNQKARSSNKTGRRRQSSMRPSSSYEIPPNRMSGQRRKQKQAVRKTIARNTDRTYRGRRPTCQPADPISSRLRSRNYTSRSTTARSLES
ncbi:MAG: hypothetical protein M4579_007281 [Chaenotheca gracillima]|nr:MAG: hypothetical protein M4579_007281 [Chaenotheca gracillima]